MQPMDDRTLLRQYAEKQCQEAFAILVTRHINLVYSVALRHLRDPHDAEEIVQAVFLILAKKAPQLRHDHALSSWLFQTTRLTANNFVRSESRRHRRDQEAHMQSVLNESAGEIWPKIAPVLDTAVAGLREKDRQAIVLRFYEGRNLREVGLALGASEEAAEKRVNRALEKLRKGFHRLGIDSTTATLAGAMSLHSVHLAPAALAQSVTTTALAGSAVSGGSFLTLAKATLLTMKTKIILITIAASALVLGTGTWFLWPAKTAPAPVTHTDAVPIKIANATFIQDGDNDGTFLVGVDPGARRTTNSAPAIHIQGPLPPAAGVVNLKTDNSSSIKYLVGSNSVLFGQHIRVTGWLKTSQVQSWASAFLMVLSLNGHSFATDSMVDRPIRGTSDWQQVEFITDVPNEPCVIYLGPDLYGPGELWADDFEIELAGPKEPFTDDRKWHVWNSNLFSYSKTMDLQTRHDGHPTVRLSYDADGDAPHGSFMWWGQSIRTPDKYAGHTVRLTGWVKTENVSDHLEPTFKPRADNYKILANDNMVKDHHLKGTLDWTPFTVTCAVPKTTTRLDLGFCFWGSGKVWIDMESVKFEIVK
jgi:RNA polymerase sigma factor (sigma-70 family)